VEGVEHTSSDRNTGRIVDEGEEQILPNVGHHRKSNGVTSAALVGSRSNFAQKPDRRCRNHRPGPRQDASNHRSRAAAARDDRAVEAVLLARLGRQ